MPAQSTGMTNRSPRTHGSKGPHIKAASGSGPRKMFFSSRDVASKAASSSDKANSPSRALPNRGSGSFPISHIGSGVRQLKTLRVG